jgi:hypothetical protein
MDDLAENNQDILDRAIDELGIYPFVDTEGDYRIFLARYEIVLDGEEFTWGQAVEDLGEPYGWIDFLGGFPIDCVEMIVGIGEWSSKSDKVYVDAGEDKVFPGVPEDGLFNWPENDRIFLNLTALKVRDISDILVANLTDPKPTKPKWWFRVAIKTKSGNEEIKFPIPGEFFGLGVRIFPGKYWGHQKSNPFIYSGNWMDTVYCTGGKVVAVNEPTEDRSYYTYTVKWHKEEIEDVKSSDYNVYEIDDRVTIVKDIETEKTSQTWEDEDAQEGGYGLSGHWMIVPVMYYDISNRPEE